VARGDAHSDGDPRYPRDVSSNAGGGGPTPGNEESSITSDILEDDLQPVPAKPEHRPPPLPPPPHGKAAPTPPPPSVAPARPTLPTHRTPKSLPPPPAAKRSADASGGDDPTLKLSSHHIPRPSDGKRTPAGGAPLVPKPAHPRKADASASDPLPRFASTTGGLPALTETQARRIVAPEPKPAPPAASLFDELDAASDPASSEGERISMLEAIADDDRPSASLITGAPTLTGEVRIAAALPEADALPTVPLSLALTSETIAQATAHPIATTPGAVSLATQRARALVAEIEPHLRAARAAEGQAASSRIGRLLLEQGAALERAGEAGTALERYEEASARAPHLLPAVAAARRLLGELASTDPAKHAKALLDALSREMQLSEGPDARADLFAERARVLERSGGEIGEIIAAFREALALRPSHAESLFGLEGALLAAIDRAPSDQARAALELSLAEHLGRMAHAFGQQPELVAGCHAARAQLLERHGDPTAAEEAYAAALLADGRVGPIREAHKRLLWSRKAWSRLRDVLAEEAGREHDLARSVRLLHHAARLSIERLGDPAQAITLLSAAASRAPTDAALDARVLDELARLLEERGELREAADVRRRRVALESEPSLAALEWRRLGSSYDELGDPQHAAAAFERARELEPLPLRAQAALDRLHAKRGDHAARVALWLDEAAKAREPARRASAYVRAARITEDQLGRVDEALELLRAAWVTDTGNLEALDELTRMMLPPVEMRMGIGGGDGRNARALIELFAQAAEVSREPARKIAYLEKAAALHEDALGDPARAAEIYQRVLQIDPARRFALLGLARAKERAGDFRGLAEAVEREASIAADPTHKDALLLRAAEVWRARAGDPTRAIDLATRVLEKNATHVGALRALLESFEAAGRDAELAEIYGRLLAIARDAGKIGEFVALGLELGELLRTRLARLDDAIAIYREVHALAADHPIATRELSLALRARGLWSEVAALETELAHAAAKRGDANAASLALVRAAEIWEDRLEDDAKAQAAYAEALALRSDDLSAWEGLARLAERRGALRELESAYRLRIERENGASRQALRIALADLMLRRHARGEAGAALSAATVLESILLEAPAHVQSLHALARLQRLLDDREAGSPQAHARVLTLFAQALRDPMAKRGVLWELSRLSEAKLPASPPIAPYLLIYESDPQDRAALAAIARLGSRRLGEPSTGDAKLGRDGLPDVRALVAFALQRMLAGASDPTTVLVLELRLAELLEDSLERREVAEALRLYRSAQSRDPMSPTAIGGVRRVGRLLEDRVAQLEGARAAANLALALPDAKQEAVSELLAGSSLAEKIAPAQGGGESVALELARHALRVDPDAENAATAVSALLRRRNDARTLVDLFMEAASVATIPARVVALAREAADLARSSLGNLPVAVALLARGREVAPDDALLACEHGDLLVEQRAWADAAAAYEAALDTQRSAPTLALHVRAHRALAALYEGALGDPTRAEAELRALVSLDPKDVAAHRRLAELLLGRRDPAGAEKSIDALLAIPGLPLEEHVRALDMKAELRLHQGDKRGAEKALRTAVRLDPDVERLAFAHLATFHDRHGDGDASLAAALAEMCETPGADPRWRIKLAELSIHRLGRAEEGIAQLRNALGGMVTAATPRSLRSAARLALAEGLLTIGGQEDALRSIREVLSDDPTDARALEAAHRTLSGLGRREESFVVDEVRAFLGHTKEAAVFRSRRSLPGALRPGALDEASLQALVLPPAGRHPALEVLATLSDQLGKVVPPDLATLHLGSRDRLGPRSGHPLRAPLDRAAAVLSVAEVDLYVQGVQDAFFYVENTDPPAVVAARWMVELPELEASFAMARMVGKIALRAHLVDKLPPARLEALVFLALEPFGVPLPRAVSADDEELGRRMHKALSRKARRTLEELAPRFGQAVRSTPFDVGRFCYAIEQAASRIGYLLTGDLTSALDHLRRFEPDAELAGEHVHAADLLRFALGTDAPTLRRRVGTTWA
jgi:hypothetical protein